MDVKNVLQTILRDGFILVFNQDRLDIVKTAEALIKAGVNNMEVTCRISKPLEKLKRLRNELPDFAAGVASLVDFPGMLETYNDGHTGDPLPSVAEVVDAGACYIVSAVNFRDESYAKFAGVIPMIPGCGTTMEIVSQFAKGANLCKVFPAKQLGGPAFVKAIDPAIHKTISLVPTGGTNAQNMGDYIEAGVLVLGGSFSMIDKPVMQRIVADQDYDLLAEKLTGIKQMIDKLRSEKWPDIDFAAADIKEISSVTGRNFNTL
jgi:2-dehydro-3-deoxyphosphogluconate aldolase/(4S)-4-hydroxy-2-oxoglutarate aldolase